MLYPRCPWTGQVVSGGHRSDRAGLGRPAQAAGVADALTNASLTDWQRVLALSVLSIGRAQPAVTAEPQSTLYDNLVSALIFGLRRFTNGTGIQRNVVNKSEGKAQNNEKK